VISGARVCHYELLSCFPSVPTELSLFPECFYVSTSSLVFVELFFGSL